jgi:hypothetical protein
MKATLLLSFFLIRIGYGNAQNEHIMALVDKTKDQNLEIWELSEYALKHLNTKEDLARFFYYWITDNIQYDHGLVEEFSQGRVTLREYSKRQDEFEVYDNRKAICSGYASLYQWFMEDVGITSEIVSGYIRDERNNYIDIESDEFRHAWNVIKIEGKWVLVDTTWGTSKHYGTSEYYFNMNPELAILTHFPEEEKWQLLDKPLSLDAFNNSKYVNKIWFLVGFSDVPRLKSDGDYFYFVFKSNPNPDWHVNLFYSQDNLNFKEITDVSFIKQDGMTYGRFFKKQVFGSRFFKVNIYQKIVEGHKTHFKTFKDVISFKI